MSWGWSISGGEVEILSNIWSLDLPLIVWLVRMAVLLVLLQWRMSTDKKRRLDI